jgi:transcriptional regulator with XRE-family HTH domain
MARSAMQQLGSRVRSARQKTGLSQEAFAEKCGMDRIYLGRIELGKQNPTITILMRIALEAGTDTATLLAGIVIDHKEIRALPRGIQTLRQ